MVAIRNGRPLPLPSPSSAQPGTVVSSEYTVHTSTLFDPKSKQVLENISVTVDKVSGLMVNVFQRKMPLPDKIQDPDIDLRGKFVLPGFVDAHTHIFLHSYKYHYLSHTLQS